jgi:hypothetical protein
MIRRRYKTGIVTAGSGGELVGICLSQVAHDRPMMEATMAIGAKCDSVRDLVGHRPRVNSGLADGYGYVIGHS